VSLVSLEKSLQQYIAQEEDHQHPFDIENVPIGAIPTADEVQPKMTNGLSSKKDVDRRNKENEGRTSLGTLQEQYASQLSRVAELESIPLGPLTKSALPVDLTESETEYFVQCIKHMFRNHVVLQFDITNTCSDQVLENTRVTFQVSLFVILLISKI
jgi:coatomer protein complex subunit gamma